MIKPYGSTNKPTVLKICGGCTRNILESRKNKSGRKRTRFKNKRISCFACGKESIIIFHPNCFGDWMPNIDKFGYPIHYLCIKCWHNIIYFKRKYPMGQRRKDGPHNPNWKGGIDTLMHKLRNHPRNKEWIKDILERDKFICQECGEHTYLHAHHIKSMSAIVIENHIQSVEDALGCPELWDITNGKSLCIDCHEKTENYLFKASKNYKKSREGTTNRTLDTFQLEMNGDS